ncbi:MAG: circularly permuted type 2 ATP-grasp protein [Planctomycetota bacterium]|nr:circularly permuted type 2 ATP-grasp protein [Planctomycetota bacterium]
MEWRPASNGFDEAFTSTGDIRDLYEALVQTFESLDEGELERREQLQSMSLINQGITFTLYGEDEGVERVFPFDFVPRIITGRDWDTIERGVVQRVTALNLFLTDLYTDQHCLREGLVPHELVFEGEEFLRELIGTRPRHGIFTHVVGTDLLRNDDGQFVVLEDNCRNPSGVSYVLENRNLLFRVFPELFNQYGIRPVELYPQMLREVLSFTAPRGRENPVIAVLTPGIYNSAYFEHSFLAREMGVPLVEGRDLIVEDDQVFMRTTRGKQRVDVLYRRIDDTWLDPVVFQEKSTLGVPGLMHAFRQGNVTIANAPGSGVADNKAIYPWIPDVIRFFLDEDPILPQVQTYIGQKSADASYIRDNLDQLVVKLCGGAGGYGMLVGPTATKKEISDFRTRFDAAPWDYIGQPLVDFSHHPTWTGDGFEPRRVDLRPFALFGDGVQVLPGGLTRVALEEGSYVVNSSQGGGSKDTWVLIEDQP